MYFVQFLPSIKKVDSGLAHKNLFSHIEFIENVSIGKVKVKVTLVQALRLCTGRKAHRGSRGIALLFHDQWH